MNSPRILRAIVFFVSVLFSLSNVGQDCLPLFPGLSGWWSGDNQARDESGNGNGASGGNVAYSAGKVGSAFNLDVNSRLTAAPASSLKVKSLTFIAWINSSQSNAQPIMEYSDENGYVGAHFWIHTEAFSPAAGHLYANLREAPGFEHPFSASDVITNNQWSLVAVTYDYASGIGRLFVNGAVVQESSLGSFQPSTDKPLRIGHRPSSNYDGGGFSGAHFIGLLDEAQVYSRALTTKEIAAIYRADSRGFCKGAPFIRPQEESLVAHYPLDGNARDASTNHLDGQMTNTTVTTDRFGNEKGALYFDGSAYVDLGNRAAFNFQSNFTMNAWVQQTNPSPYAYIIGKYFSSGPFENASHSYGLGADEVGGPYGFVLGEGVIYTDLRGQALLADGRWHALSLTYDRGVGLQLYLDAQLLGFAPILNLPPFSNEYPLFLGRIASGNYFRGSLDDVSLWDRALSDGEILALYQSQRAELPVPLQNATASFSQSSDGDFSVARAIDASVNDNLGWAISPDIGNQTAVFETTEDLGSAQATHLTFRLRFNHRSVPGSTSHTLGKFRLSATADDRGTFADGLQSGGDVVADWTILNVVSATAESGAILTTQSDGSILASGVLREFDQYTVVVTTSLNGITGFRLEALTDPTLPFGGPGREPLNGNFVLTDLAVTQSHFHGPVITGQPSSATVAPGSSVTLSVTASSAALPLIYQWYLNGGEIVGATNETLLLQKVGLPDTGTYTVAIQSREGMVSSAGAVVTVLPENPSGAGRLIISNRVPEDAPIFGADGTLLSGPKYLAQAYVASGGVVFRRSGPAVPFLSGTNSGFFTPIDLYLPDTFPGDALRVRIVVWDSSAGASYEEALGRGGERGESEVVEGISGGGALPPTALAGLRSFRLVAPPHVVTQPSSRTVYRGDNVSFQVAAVGSAPLIYQWQFNSNDIVGATAPMLLLTNVQVDQAGAYSVVVRNSYGSTRSEPALLVVNLPDLTPPVIAITAPAGEVTYDPVGTLRGTVIDDVRVAAARWELNGQSLGPLVLQEGRFSITNAPLARGTNTFRVIATDSSGNESAASATLTFSIARRVSVGETAAVQEGARLAVPILFSSRGDVSGVTFSLSYDRTYLEDPEVLWDAAFGSAFLQVNTNTPGTVRASFAFSGTTLPAGEQRLAEVVFHARSVPGNMPLLLRLLNVSVYSVSGDPLTAGTDVFSGSALIRKRKYIGDNNANDRLDVGDASIMMRLVTSNEIAAPWDVFSNDLNENQQLDVGDVIRVLRAVVGLDPQPGTSTAFGVQAAPAEKPATTLAGVGLTLDKKTAAPGEKVKLTVNLSNFHNPISGASFKLRYPVAALRLDYANARHAGSVMPPNAVTLWNLSPEVDNYAQQDGSISLAASSELDWNGGYGTLAEFTFTVQSGATNQYDWAIELSAAEVSSGFDLLSLEEGRTSFHGRAPANASVQAVLDPASNSVRLSLSGEPSRYTIEVSDDLKIWSDLGAFDNGQPNATREIEAAASHRFYRARLQD